MQQLEQLHASLLLGGINVLISFDDVDINSELLGMCCQRLVAGGNLRITLGTQIPDSGGIFHQKREIATLQQGQDGSRVGPDQIAHARIEAVVYMSQDEIEVGTGRDPDPLSLQPASEACAIVEKRAQIFLGERRTLEQTERIESRDLTKILPDIGVHGREASRVRGAFQRFEIQLCQVHAIPIERVEQL